VLLRRKNRTGRSHTGDVRATGRTGLRALGDPRLARTAVGFGNGVPMSQQQALEYLQSRIGQEIHVSEWFEVTQARIDAFAESTGDRQWIHTDVERAARESPWKSTIAHGYMTLSLYPMLRGLEDIARVQYPGVRQMVNYGLDRVRFPNAVLSGSRVRARCVLLKVEPVTGGLQVGEQYTVEIDGQTKPACVAEAIMRAYF
jgi:acyl dehydratase